MAEPVVADVAPPPPVPEAPVEPSLGEHEQEFPFQSRHAPPRSPVPDSETPEGERDAQGRFKGRHRAKSQEATPADVPRIQELTRKLREAEAERDTTKAERDALKASPARTEPPAVAALPPPSVTTTAAATTPPKPKQEDFKDYEEFSEALIDWKTDRRFEAEAIKRQEAEQKEFVQRENARVAESWRARVDAAIKLHPDFEDIALKAPTSIKPGSYIDAFILEHKHGALVLYDLQQHPEEVTRLNTLRPLDQIEALTLLAQRLTVPSTRPQAVSTGSAAAPVVPPAPRPPNPVRTGPMRTSDEPPGDEASLADHEKYYGSVGHRR